MSFCMNALVSLTAVTTKVKRLSSGVYVFTNIIRVRRC